MRIQRCVLIAAVHKIIMFNVIMKDINDSISVYRFSQEKFISYLMKKVARLRNAEIQDGSRTLIRVLAKNGLLDEGNEQLLECKLYCLVISN